MSAKCPKCQTPLEDADFGIKICANADCGSMLFVDFDGSVQLSTDVAPEAPAPAAPQPAASTSSRTAATESVPMMHVRSHYDSASSVKEETFPHSVSFPGEEPAPDAPASAEDEAAAIAEEVAAYDFDAELAPVDETPALADGVYAPVEDSADFAGDPAGSAGDFAAAGNSAGSAGGFATAGDSGAYGAGDSMDSSGDFAAGNPASAEDFGGNPGGGAPTWLEQPSSHAETVVLGAEDPVGHIPPPPPELVAASEAEGAEGPLNEADWFDQPLEHGFTTPEQLNVSANETVDFSDVVEFANSAELDHSPLAYTLWIEGIDSGEIRARVEDVLSDSRLNFHLGDVMKNLKKGVLELRDLNPVKASFIASRLRAEAVNFRWRQSIFGADAESEGGAA